MAWESSAPPEWIAPRQHEVLRRTLEQLHLNIDQLDLAHLQQLFAWGPIPGVRVFPDTFEVLDTIRAWGVQIGLMTNSSSPMWMRDRELEAMGLLQYLDVRLTAGDVGHLKPHRRAFEAVLNRLGTRPDEAVFVGDRQHDDIVGAQQVGMRAVWVQRGTEDIAEDVQPDATIESLSELPPRLDAWFPNWRSSTKGSSAS
jgi:2-haloalkanoic acid dehalogenase type II